MAVSRSQQEALKKLRKMCPEELIATFFEARFPQTYTPCLPRALLCDALALFYEHWSCAEGEEVHVYAHNAVDSLGRTDAK